MQPPFFCDYGSNIELGERVFFNFNCVVLDVCMVRIGSFSLFGPAVQIYLADHSTGIPAANTPSGMLRVTTTGAGPVRRIGDHGKRLANNDDHVCALLTLLLRAVQ